MYDEVTTFGCRTHLETKFEWTFFLLLIQSSCLQISLMETSSKETVDEETWQLLMSRNTICALRDDLLIQLSSVNGKLNDTKYKKILQNEIVTKKVTQLS